MQKKGIVAVLGGRQKGLAPAVVLVVLAVLGKPVLGGERWIGHAVVEGLQEARRLELRVVQGVALPDFRIGDTVKEHVQLGK